MMDRIPKISDKTKIFEFIFNNLFEGVYILYKEKFIMTNPYFEELFGYSKKELNNKNFKFWKLVAPESVEMLKERLSYLKKGKPLPSPYFFYALHKNGQKILMEANVKYFTIMNDTAVLGIVRDVSKRHDHNILEIKDYIKNNREKFENICKFTFLKLYEMCRFSGGGIFIFDNNKIKYISFQKKEIKDKIKIFHLSRKVINRLFKEKINRLEVDVNNDESKSIAEKYPELLEIFILPIRVSSEIIGGMFIAEDKRYKINDHTISLYRETCDYLGVSHGTMMNLEQIENKKRNIDIINEELRSRNQKIKQFLDDLKHEIMIPINAILGHSSLSIELYDGLIEDSRKSKLYDILKEGKRLKELLMDVENLSIYDSDEREPILLFDTIISKNIQIFYDWLKERNITIKYEGKFNMPQLFIDRRIFDMIVVNMIRNIEKYSNNDSEANIKALSGNPHFFYLDFKNYGIGIPKGEEEKIFDEGYRGSNVLSIYPKLEGQGLGLHFVKEQLNKYNSYIKVVNNSNPSIFRIYLSKSLVYEDKRK